MNSNIIDIYSLTPSQEGMYAQYFQNQDTKTYQLQNISRISKDVDLKLLEKSVELLSVRHQVLKSAFTVLKSTGAIKQVILENRKPFFAIVSLDESFSQEALDKAVEENTKSALDLQTDSLFRVTVFDFLDARFMLMHAHHIILDGWCLPVLINDLQKYYGELQNNKSIEALTDEIKMQVSDETSYAQYANWIRKQNTDEVSAYWQNLLNDCSPTHIFGKEKKANSRNEDIITFRTPLTTELSQSIELFAKENKVSSNSVFECAFSIALQKFSNSEDVVFDKTISGRSIPLKNIENTVGPFINTVPVRIQTNENSTLAEVLKETQTQTINANQFGILSLADLYKQTGIDAKSVDALFVFENYFVGDTEEIANGPLALHVLSADEQTEFNLNVTILKENRDYAIRTSYAKEFYTEKEVESFVKGYISILNSSLNANALIKDISVLSDEEKEKVITSFNDTSVEYAKDKCIHELFEEQVERTPDKVALVANDKTLTYAKLNEEANIIAHSLIEKGIGKCDIVGIKLSRTSKFMVSLLGILKSGAAYLPFDPTHPQDRIEQILSDSNAKLCITENNFNELLDNTNTENPDIETSGESLCYCIYTSGSTGTPKGAMIQHKNLCWYMSSLMSIYGTDAINMPFFTSPAVDLSIPSYFLPLVTGGTTYFYDNELLNDLNDIFNNEEINTIKVTPTHLQIILQHIEGKTLHNMKYLISGGESLRRSSCIEFLEKFGEHIEIHNEYGPTETTVSCVDHIFSSEDNDDIVTIGSPIDNAQIYIVDKYTNLLPIGLTGELCIAGDGVCAGYLNNEQLTNEKFIDNPFGTGKLYKTGDLAYWREDGTIVFVGRNDFQVKINGQRIELGEIENAIADIDGVVQCAVIVREQYICAFYTGAVTDARDFRTILSAKLPRYMIPHIFVHLEEMPLTSSGKTNKNALPEIDLDNISTGIEYIAPETEKETILANAIATVLNIERVSMLDNFFDLGGDSLLSIELTSELESKGYTVVVKSIFEAKDIQSLAKELTAKTEKEEKIEYGSVLPATAAQMSIYSNYFISEEPTLYNIPLVFKVESLDANKFEKVINKLIARHEGLRTSFENRDGEIVQIINNDISIKLERLESLNPNNFIRPFDLSKAPLLRVGYYENTVMVNFHHIIADGSTIALFYREINELYMGRELPETVQYGDFAVTNQYTNEDENFWLNEYEDVPVLELYTDFPKSESPSFKGTNIFTRIDNKLNEKILNKCKELGITPYDFYMACYNILLSKFSANEDICIGVPSSGRSSKYLNTWGMFVNVLAMRNQPTGTKIFKDFVNEVKNKSFEAISHQNYPQQELIKKIEYKKTLYDVMFIYQSEKMTHVVLGDKKAELLPVTISTSRSSLGFTILPREEDIVLMAEYRTDLFEEETINKFIKAYTSILTQALNENSLIKDISVLSYEEKEKVITSFNNTTVEYPKDKCIHKLFEEQVERTPDKVALVAVDKKLTYKELNEEANKIAHSLIEKGIGKGDIVGLMLPRKSYLLSALFGILKTGAAYLPIDMELPAERIEYMCQDTNAKLVVSQDNIDSLLASDNKTNPNVEMTNDSLCYCIYTSGSTGQPKGVMARHKNVVNYISKNEHNIFGKIVKDDFETIVSISTCSFDIFVTETIATLVNGLRVVLADEQECRNQYALNRLLTREKGEFLQTTPTKLKVLTKDPSQREFLKNVKAILLGGEAMEQSYLDELKELTDAKIYNIYGVTEVPIWSVFADTDTFTDAITIGKPIANTQVYIVDKYMNPVPVGMTGELCIAGDSVSSGYLNNPELTTEKFIDNPFGSGKLYKTGDHAYWREDGNLVFIGRKDFQVKIRGLRIELGEIESVLQAVEGVERAVVVVRKDKEDRQLLCAFFTGEDYNAKDLRTILNAKLPKYMVPHIFTHLEEMPLTSSGKANRNALPEIDLDNISTETEYVAPTTEKEVVLVKAIETVLDIEKVSTLDNFFDIGGDSLKSIELVSVLEDKGYTVIVKSIFEAKDIQSLAKELTVKTEKDETVQYDSVMPATAAQMRIYTAQIMSPDSLHYNLLAAFKVDELDANKLEESIYKLIVRHESLRTSFENRDGQIVQIINEPTTIKVEKLDSDDESLFNTPFDLSKAPLLKVGYYDNTVMLVIHHIITDGESMTVLCKELNELYMGRELPETVQYGEFAVTDSYTKENEKYWLNVFSEETTELQLPLDYQRPDKQTFEGSHIYEQIDISTHNKIADKCKALGITPYAYYMACYNVLLSKFSGNEDICVGMPISGRSSKFLNTIGMFVNTVVLRTNTDGNKTVRELMQEIRENSISAIDNQSYPYNELVKKLGISSSNRNPLFDVMFAYQSEALPVIIFGDKEVQSLPVKLGGVKCDLNFNIVPTRDKIALTAEYNTDLFKEETINKFIKAYTSILTQALNENILIKDISVLSDEEKEKVITSFNDTEHTYNIPDNSTLYSMFEKASEENRDKVCIIANEEEISYRDFKEYVERIDNKVRSITNEEKSVIAVICERSFEMYGAVYGIIRGGNAYLPIDPNYPQDRIDYILSNSGAKAVVAQDKFCHLAGNVPCIDATAVLNSTEQPTKTECLALPEDTAYVIYTSGSTGNPKGAKISHKSAINRILWMHDFYPLEDNDVILQKTPYTFDVSVWELFWWGMTGRTLCASKPDEHFLPAKILEETERNKVTHLHFVPSVFDLFLTYLENNKDEQDKFNSVKYVFLSGEALTANHINRFYNIYDYNKIQLHNLYGPTECAVDVSYYACAPTDIDPVPIGKPIYNTQLYIVDKYLNPTPVGVTGELCIAGVNVGQGYLNNEELTNEKFIPNPFGTGKLYKTGDLAYWREDGNICYVGRMDNQIKLNGQRVELGEIEKVISDISDIDSVAVIIKENNGQDALVAFCCGNEDALLQVVDYCETKLPHYMVPSKFQFIEKLPLNQSGKLDRKALKNIKVAFDSVTIKEEPVTDTEKLLCGLFQDILGIDFVGRNESFFNLGGTSLDMIAILSENELQNIPSADFIANPTPEKLAKLIDGGNIPDSDGFYTLRNVIGSNKALILLPYAGGDASAFAALTKTLETLAPKLSIYYIDYLRSYEQCKIVADKINELSKTKEINIYSHCAGTAVALQLINILEEQDVNVANYITGGFIPPAKPSKRNSWNYTLKSSIQRKLIKAGAPIEKFSAESNYNMVEKFRKDTDFMTEYFYKRVTPINANTSVIISKTDIFTQNYETAEKMWKTLANNFDKLYYIDSDSHYFQTEKSEQVAQIIIDTIAQ